MTIYPGLGKKLGQPRCDNLTRLRGDGDSPIAKRIAAQVRQGISHQGPDLHMVIVGARTSRRGLQVAPKAAKGASVGITSSPHADGTNRIGVGVNTEVFGAERAEQEVKEREAEKPRINGSGLGPPTRGDSRGDGGLVDLVD